VQAVTLFNFGFLSGNSWTDGVLAEGYEAEPGEDLECAGTLVGPHFFETFGMSLVAGRDFDCSNLMLTWTGGTILQRSDSVSGPWADVGGVSSPYSVVASGSSGYFRIKQP